MFYTSVLHAESESEIFENFLFVFEIYGPYSERFFFSVSSETGFNKITV